jgi:hypothetical protein
MTSVPTPSPAITAIVKVFIGSNTIVAGNNRAGEMKKPPVLGEALN